jgi:type II secretory pathway component GspD/PulD (secretin)
MFGFGLSSLSAMLLGPLLWALSAQATTQNIRLDMKLSVNGQLVSSPHMITRNGEKATIQQSLGDQGDEFVIESLSSGEQVDLQQAVLMKFRVSLHQGGHVVTLAQPQIVALNGEQAEVSVSPDVGPYRQITLTVTPTVLK